ncbi:hypothetical protein MTR67_012321 [Solanum verrucosum]|uniref:Tf2-1-like SH3-like domain-containing protein n=1 Tax=Solanum verrucosum TaxID=315347 RepID=A0AAF0TGW5_SOLVR|nr:hypothetical protein MTR67_012321 [Solanum verrucosum]
MRLKKKGQLTPRIIEPFEILSRVVELAYKLSFLPSLSVAHPVFHIFMLQKKGPDYSHVLSLDSVELGPNIPYEGEPIAILDRQVQKLRTIEIASMKVHWNHHSVVRTLRRKIHIRSSKLEVRSLALCSRTDMVFSGG